MAQGKFIIELTNHCNLNCKMCPRQHIKMKLGYMDMDLWYRLTGLIRKGSTILPFWRGESTLHPNFTEMIKSLDAYHVVLATNGTNPQAIVDVLPHLDTINVSIHNEDSYMGYCEIRDYIRGPRPKLIASMVEGETSFLNVSRVYKEHTVEGKWGKVNMELPLNTGKMICKRLQEVVVAWDGEFGRCCYVWDTRKWVTDPYPDKICQQCNQWLGEGKTL